MRESGFRFLFTLLELDTSGKSWKEFITGWHDNNVSCSSGTVLKNSTEHFELCLPSDISLTRCTARLQASSVLSVTHSVKSPVLEPVLYQKISVWRRSSMEACALRSSLMWKKKTKKKSWKWRLKTKRAANEVETKNGTESEVDFEHRSIWASFTAVETHRRRCESRLEPSA